MSTFCGLYSPYKTLRHSHSEASVYPADEAPHPSRRDVRRKGKEKAKNQTYLPQSKSSLKRRKSANFEWAREDQLSIILEILEGESRRNTPNWDNWDEDEIAPNWEKVPRIPSFHPSFYQKIGGQEFGSLLNSPSKSDHSIMSERRASPESVRPFLPPPRDLESISRIDASLVFEHFTTEDAWALGSSLRNRLLPIPTPVVINISLANQNQTLFHTCTHSGVMPDNDNWVARKRKTVLRWGVSTWYMHCKFGGDEVAFREKYGLGNSAGEYAIHGGGVPIRVTGVEGVVAVVVVSGLKQDEDHAVIVEVIKDLYY